MISRMAGLVGSLLWGSKLGGRLGISCAQHMVWRRYVCRLIDLGVGDMRTDSQWVEGQFAETTVSLVASVSSSTSFVSFSLSFYFLIIIIHEPPHGANSSK